MHQLPEALRPLADYAQFIVWSAVWDGTKNKYLKKPCDPRTGFNHDPTDSSIWMSADDALAVVQSSGHLELGFVFAESDPFWFLDIDNCLVDGDWSPLAKNLMTFFEGAAVEVSHSGSGLHIFGTGSPPDPNHRNKPLLTEYKGCLEFYTKGRFVALTGTSTVGSASTEHNASLAQVIPYYFPARVDITDEWTEVPHPDWNGPADDDALIEKMLASAMNATTAFDETKAGLKALWTCDADALGRAYPSVTGQPYDGSGADQALCNHLAFWTGADCERIDRLYRRSDLYREKWERDDYREDTILRATSSCSAFYSSKPKTRDPLTEADSVAPESVEVVDRTVVTQRSGLQFLAPVAQAELFKGCVYIRDLHKIYVPDGGLLSPEVFKASFGGYLFALDAIGDKTEKNAFTVFTESQAANFPRAHNICFRPELAPGQIIKEDGWVLLNTYVPVDTPSIKGDISRFHNHLALLLPDARDRAIVTAYMAAIVQNKGHKFAWAPLIQGIEGNGKSLLIAVMTAAVGSRYTHKPNAAELGSGGAKFTKWLDRKLFIGIEEIYVSDRREVSDALKPLITDERIEIQGKGADQIMGDNRANFIMCSNHKDAILKNKGDRRYAVFFTAQQTPDDLHRAGMVLADGETPTRYFPDLYGWLKNEGGFSFVTNFLENYEIPAGLNPAELCVRAPRTSSTVEAIEQSRGGVEQEVAEAIYQNRPGFAGGWVSSMALDNLLEGLNSSRKIPRSRRGLILDEIGFIPHPGLVEGRSNVVIPLDGGKPRLYVKKGSIQSGFVGATIIVDAYVKAQGLATSSLGSVEEKFSRV